MKDWQIRIAVDITITVVLSFILLALSNVFVWHWPYWVCFVVAAVVVFLGELLIPAILDGDVRWLD